MHHARQPVARPRSRRASVQRAAHAHVRWRRHHAGGVRPGRAHRPRDRRGGGGGARARRRGRPGRQPADDDAGNRPGGAARGVGQPPRQRAAGRQLRRCRRRAGRACGGVRPAPRRLPADAATLLSLRSAPRRAARGSRPVSRAAARRSARCRRRRWRPAGSTAAAPSPTTWPRKASFPDEVRAGKCLLPPARVAAYVELHIEQGPVLDSEEIPVGIVTGIPGSRRLRARARARRIQPFRRHARAATGATRAIALAELATRLDDRWAELDAEGHALVCTFCVLATAPEAGFTKVPGEARFQLDVRSVDAGQRGRDLLRVARAGAADRGAPRRAVRPRRGSGLAADAAACRTCARAWRGPRRLWACRSARCRAAAATTRWRSRRPGVPAGMLFVRNQNGSHNPHEAMRMEDFAAATTVLTRWAAEMAK